MHLRRVQLPALATAGALLVTLMPSASHAAARSGGAAAADGASGSSPSVVTLVTGDRVRLERFPDGRQAATVTPRDGAGERAGEGGGFEQWEIDGDLHVVPSDAMPYVASGALDRDLFNITELVAQGYGDGRSKRIPLIVSYAEGARTADAAELPGVRAGAALPSLRGRAVEAGKEQAGRFWEAVDDDREGARRAAEPRLAGGIERIWLDGKVSASLDRSVPQIGAPEVWRGGHDGTGVTVAVLDTGVDAGHPDLAGRVDEARNFSDSPTTGDAFGHGTHVAATVAGTGAGADGTRKGVAPGARLLVGKVLGDDGYGTSSQVLAGMEWAARSGADVVNMSLGSDAPTDGTDPLSLGVNRLTAETGTLFVASAGNSGPRSATVGSPGAADAALTVGAVGRDESLADFSSRGPRVGDLAVKPDITAPGVDIVAARAAGTSMGTPVDDLYTAASGTSMAAPHVAGAAALLAQRHPDWTAEQLKDALVSTALRHEDLTVYEQGGGRVDAARADAQQVYATGTLGFGGVEEGGEPVRREITYTNTSDAPVTLELAAELRAASGEPVPAGAVGLPGGDTVEVAAGGTATVAVTLDPQGLRPGRYGGYVTATAGGGTVAHTTVGAVREAPTRTVTLRGIDRAGQPAFVNPVTLFGDDDRYDVVSYIPEGRSRTVEVPEGDYFLHAVISDKVVDGSVDSVVVDPQLEVDRDMEVVLDAREANEVEIRTPKPAVQEAVMSFYTHREFGSRSVSHGHMEFSVDGRRLYVTPTDAAREGTFEFTSRWQLEAPMLTGVARGPHGREPIDGIRLMGRSPALDGTRRLPLADAGAGAPEDYAALADRGVDLSRAAVLVDGTSPQDEDAVRAAAAAGARTVIVAGPEGSPAWSVWRPRDTRLPATAAMVRHDVGVKLRAALAAGRTTVELDGTPASPYLYDVMQVSEQRVPERVLHRVTSANTATVQTRYQDSGGFPWTKEQRFGWRPWMDTAINQYQRHVPTPHTRTEYVSAGDTIWRHQVHHRYTYDTLNPLAGGMIQPARTYRAGERLRESWFAPVVRPAIPRGVEGLTSYREGDRLTVRIPEYADGQAGHYSRADGGDWGGVPADTTSAELYRDGEKLAEGRAAWGDFPAGGDGEGRYRLDLAVDRDTPEWRTSVSTRTSWSFAADRPAPGEQELLPLLQLDYDVPTDAHGAAAAGRLASFDVTARHQDGVEGRRVKGMEVSVSYDDGERWQRAVALRWWDGDYRVWLRHPPAGDDGGFVSLRVRAWDDAGNSVTQTVKRAYALR